MQPGLRKQIQMNVSRTMGSNPKWVTIRNSVRNTNYNMIYYVLLSSRKFMLQLFLAVIVKDIDNMHE